MIKVHLLTHTHGDMGWVRTVDEYYTGGNKKKLNFYTLTKC